MPAPQNQTFMVIVAPNEQKSLTVAQIADMFGQGLVTSETFVWREGMAEWLPIAQVAELRSAMPEREASTGVRAAEIDDVPTRMVQTSGPLGGGAPPRPAAGAPPPETPSGPTNVIAAARRPDKQRPAVDLFSQAQPQQPEPERAPAPGTPFVPGSAPAAPPPLQQIPQSRPGVHPGLAAYMPKESSLMALPTAFFMAQLESPRRKKRLAGVIAVCVVLFGVGVFLGVRAFDTKGKQLVDEAYARTYTCVLGEPLGARETVTQRLRNVQVVVVGQPVERRSSKAGEPVWPVRCANEARALAATAKDAGLMEVSANAEALAKAMQDDPSSTVGFSEPAEKLFAEANKAQLKPASSAAGISPAPKPAKPATDEELRGLPRFLSGTVALSNVRVEPFPTATIRFLVDQADLPEGPQLCSVSGGDSAIKCKKVPPSLAKLSPGLRLWGTHEEGSKPLVFAGDHGASGIYRSDGQGEQVGSGFATGAVSRKDGSFAVVLRKDASRDARLLVGGPSGSGSERGVVSSNDGGNVTYSTGIFWDWVAYRTGPKAVSANKLTARKLEGQGEPGAPVEMGAVDEQSPGELEAPRAAMGGKRGKQADQGETDDDRMMAGCKSDSATFVRMRGIQNDFVSAYVGNKWSSPVKATTHGGAITCRKNEAVLLKTTPLQEQDRNWPIFDVARCNISGCTAARATMKELLPSLPEVAPADPKLVSAVEVDGKVLVIWNGGYLGGIRMRLAPVEKLKETDDVVLFDDREDKGTMKLTTVTELRAVSNGAFAVVFMTTPVGARVVKIDGSGAMTPLSVRAE